MDKPNPYVRWVDRWEPLTEAWQPESTSGRNCSVRQPLLVYNKVPRVYFTLAKHTVILPD